MRLYDQFDCLLATKIKQSWSFLTGFFYFCERRSNQREFEGKYYYSNQNQRELVVELSNYLAGKLETIRTEEASAARVLREMMKNQRLG